MQKAGNRYFAGIAISAIGAGVSIIGSANGSDEISIAGGVTMLTGAIVSITGHSMLIKAGRKLNDEAIAITPASQGIGVAINF